MTRSSVCFSKVSSTWWLSKCEKIGYIEQSMGPVLIKKIYQGSWFYGQKARWKELLGVF